MQIRLLICIKSKPNHFKGRCTLPEVKMQVETYREDPNTPGMAMSNLNPDQSIIPGVAVVNQAPIERPVFPISYKRRSVLAISILKCIVGVVLMAVGIANIFVIPYYTSWIAFPVWCGILILVNGIFGSCSYKYQKKCLIATFLSLNIASLIFDVIMVGFFSATLDYFREYLSAYFKMKSSGICSSFFCFSFYSHSTMVNSVGLSAFLIFLNVFELCLSTAAMVYSCKAYSLFCNTCAIADCATFVGCCECRDRIPYAKQKEMGPVHPTQSSPSYQTQNASQIASSSLMSPCAPLINLVINITGSQTPDSKGISYDVGNPGCNCHRAKNKHSETYNKTVSEESNRDSQDNGTERVDMGKSNETYSQSQESM